MRSSYRNQPRVNVRSVCYYINRCSHTVSFAAQSAFGSLLFCFDGSFPVGLIIKIFRLYPVRWLVFLLIFNRVTFGVINSSWAFYFWLSVSVGTGWCSFITKEDQQAEGEISELGHINTLIILPFLQKLAWAAFFLIWLPLRCQESWGDMKMRHENTDWSEMSVEDRVTAFPCWVQLSWGHMIKWKILTFYC